MSSTNRIWAAGGVAMVNSLSDQGQKLKSGFKSLNYGKQRFLSGSGAADLRPLSAFLTSDLGGIIGGTEQKEDSLRQVMYMNCWGQS